MDPVLSALRQYFGYSALRPGQREIIDASLAGRDVLAVMPTGGGKSLCYQLPALLLPPLTLVVSPLISLMADQTGTLLRRGISAAFLASSQSFGEQSRVLRALEADRIRILYVSPERLSDGRIRALAAEHPISLIAVDEAHCISAWGREFRPAYRNIRSFIEGLPQRPPVSAFTATATPRVLTDIREVLGLRDPYRISTGFDRRNLYYEVRHPRDKYAALLRLLEDYRGLTGIVYCRTRAAVVFLHRRLRFAGFSCVRCHGGLDAAERLENETAWLTGRVRLMIATCAFGMGIDQSHVRYVIHYQLPGDMESYYQEAGRAGRDGEPADCILLSGEQDAGISRFFISRASSPALRAEMEESLAVMRVYAAGRSCLRAQLLRYFGENAPDFCGRCSVCLRLSAPGPVRSREEDSRLLLRDLLRLRRRIAEERHIKPWHIFSDRVLGDFARIRPVTLPEMMAVEGAGIPSSIRFGRAFLREIRLWNETHPLPPE